MLIQTPRLQITHFTPSMAFAVHKNSLDEDTRRFVPDEVFETEEEAADTIAYLISCYTSGDGPLVYPVLLKNDLCIGYVQAIPMENGEWEIGYHIAKSYTGHGYATEAVISFLPDILYQLGIDKIYGVCLAENVASRKVMENAGFLQEFDGMGIYQGREQHIVRMVYRNF